MRILIFIILWFGTAEHITAQALDVKTEVKDNKFVLQIQNNLPCDCVISAKHKSLSEKFQAFFKKGDKKTLITLPADSISDHDAFKEEVKFNFMLGDPNAVPDPEYQYLLPFPQGKSYRLIQGNEGRFSHKNPSSKYAFDFEMPVGSYVSAARGGVVGYVEDQYKESGIDETYLERDNKIMICHDDGTVGSYAHLKYNGALVEVGEQVFAGQVIGLSGNTGYSTVPHLHFVVTAGDKSVPIRFRNLPNPLVPHRYYKQNMDF